MIQGGRVTERLQLPQRVRLVPDRRAVHPAPGDVDARIRPRQRHAVLRALHVDLIGLHLLHGPLHYRHTLDRRDANGLTDADECRDAQRQGASENARMAT